MTEQELTIVALKLATEIKYSGITVDEKEIRFDFQNDSDNDIIKLASYKLNCSKFKNNVYWFGYQFEKSATSKQRTDFINYIKGIGGKKIPDTVLRKFIELPMTALSSKINTYHIDAFVYPVSGRSPLVQKMIKVFFYTRKKLIPRLLVGVGNLIFVGICFITRGLISSRSEMELKPKYLTLKTK